MRAALLLAAGGSRRFGRGDKLTARVGGRTLLHHALERAAGTGVQRLVVVIPSFGGRIGRLAAAAASRSRGMRIVRAARHRDGLGASLAAGLSALRPIDREVLIFLADMPLATVHRRVRLGAGQDALRPVFRGKPGHPMLVRTMVARGIVNERGDSGLAGGLSAEGWRGSAANLIDIDTPAALRAFRRGHYRAPRSS